MPVHPHPLLPRTANRGTVRGVPSPSPRPPSSSPPAPDTSPFPLAAPLLQHPPGAPPPREEQPLHNLISAGYMCLAVNLEGTLIDIVKPSSISKWAPDMQKLLHTAAAMQDGNNASLIQLPVSRLWIKLRPGWHACLHSLACFYSLWLVRLLDGGYCWPSTVVGESPGDVHASICYLHATQTITALLPTDLMPLQAGAWQQSRVQGCWGTQWHAPHAASQHNCCSTKNEANPRALQVTELSLDVVTEIQNVLDPHRHLFGGRLGVKSAVMEHGAARGDFPAKKRPVRRLSNVGNVASVRQVTLILDNKQQMLWHSAESKNVLHCERYPFFPRVSQVRASCDIDHVLDVPLRNVFFAARGRLLGLPRSGWCYHGATVCRGPACVASVPTSLPHAWLSLGRRSAGARQEAEFIAGRGKRISSGGTA
jgi:hypothetical protein